LIAALFVAALRCNFLLEFRYEAYPHPKILSCIAPNSPAQITCEILALRFSFVKIICVLKIPRHPSQSTFDVVVCLVMLKAPNCDGRHFFVV